jgi:medium-chain acyl-[acyl-carrier-protein] hydrolase
VRRLEGLPEDVLANSGALDLLLPALEADTALYRRYVYEPEPRFDLPLIALGGMEDPNVTEAHLSAWKEQTLAAFEARQLEGGHFYLRSNQTEVREVLRRALVSVRSVG